MSTPSLINSVQSLCDASALSLNEEELISIRRIRNGDREALTSLLDIQRVTLTKYFANRISSREEVEDLVGDTLAAVIRGIDTFRGISKVLHKAPASPHELASTLKNTCAFDTFVYAIASNHFKMWSRRKANAPTIISNSFPNSSDNRNSDQDTRADSLLQRNSQSITSPDPLMAVLRREELDSACFALADVGIRSGEQFKALIFHYACGLPHKEVADLLSTRKEVINTRLQEGRTSLKAHYANKRAA